MENYCYGEITAGKRVHSDFNVTLYIQGLDLFCFIGLDPNSKTAQNQLQVIHIFPKVIYAYSIHLNLQVQKARDDITAF